MSDAFQTFLLVFLALLPIVNPPGSALLFLAITRRGSRQLRAALARQIATYAFLIMIVALYVGAFVLELFGISVPVLRVAGGAVLALSGWRALEAPRQPAETAQADPAGGARELEGMAFYPLTMPLTAGPGTVAVAIAVGTRGSGEQGLSTAIAAAKLVSAMAGAALAALGIAALVYVCYRYADRIERALGERGSDALGRLFAFILICIGVQVLWTGFAELWGTLPQR
jgi:multiple antibiotic resistance protein